MNILSFAKALCVWVNPLEGSSSKYVPSPKVHRARSLLVWETESSRWFSDYREEEGEWKLLGNPSMKSLDRETTFHSTWNKDSLQITPRNGDLGSLESPLQILFWGEMRSYCYRTLRGKLVSTRRNLNPSVICFPKKSGSEVTQQSFCHCHSLVSLWDSPWKVRWKHVYMWFYTHWIASHFCMIPWSYQIFIENAH